MSEAAKESTLSWTRKFGLGGLGGLLPIFVDLLTIDISNIASIVDHPHSMTVGIYVGYTLRTIILFSLGGIMAALNSDIHKPFTLVQLGVVAPALITSYTNGVPASTVLSKYKISEALFHTGAISTALAEPPPKSDKKNEQEGIQDARARLFVEGIVAGLLGNLLVGSTVHSHTSYLVINKKVGSCVTVPETPFDKKDISELQKIFPPPDYEVHYGVCPEQQDSKPRK